MPVRAKFRCTTITYYEVAGRPGEVGSKRFEFAAAYGDDNKEWAKYTPSGQLTMVIDNPAAWQFEIGHHYFLDLSSAE